MNVGTLGVLAVVMVWLSGRRRTGSETFPRTPLWSRNDVGIVWVGPVRVIRPFGSHMTMWSMHEAWFGFDGGITVGV